MTRPEPTKPQLNRSQPTELGQLPAVSSIVDVVARHVDGLEPIPADELADWLAALAVPAGWKTIPLDANATPLARMTVYGQPSEGTWEACETISVFRFTGVPPHDVVEDNADCTLRDLGAGESIFTCVAPPPPPGVAAVRSSGHFSVAGKRLWGRYATYIAGSEQPGQGRLIHHSIFVDYGSYFRLGHDVGQLTRAVHHAFLTTIGADPADAKWLAPGSATATGELRKDDGTVAIPLTDSERYFMYMALSEWGGLASYKPRPLPILGVSDWAEFDALTDRLATAITQHESLSDLDWARALFLTEISWASDLVGAGVEFALISHSDEEAVRLLRSIQRKISSRDRANLLFPNAGRPRPSFDSGVPKREG
jgi:hypothetical protein